MKAEQSLHARATVPHVPIGTEYTLNEAEVAFCHRIGIERLRNDRKAQCRDLRYSQQASAVVSIQGVMGECAAMRMFGVSTEPLCDTHPRSSMNDTFDMLLADRTVDVKCTHWSRGGNRLRVYSGTKRGKIPRSKADVYALVVWMNANSDVRSWKPRRRREMPTKALYLKHSTSTFRFMGFTDRRTLFRPRNRVESPCPNRSNRVNVYYEMDQSELVAWKDLSGLGPPSRKRSREK